MSKNSQVLAKMPLNRGPGPLSVTTLCPLALTLMAVSSEHNSFPFKDKQHKQKVMLVCCLNATTCNAINKFRNEAEVTI